MSKFLILILLLIFSIKFSNAQTTNVEIKQDSIINNLENLKIKIDKENFESEFYTIQLYNGTLEKSKNVIKKFKKIFPNEKTSLSFETPNYKVQFGNYKFKIIGLKKLHDLKKYFPSAFLLKKEL